MARGASGIGRLLARAGRSAVNPWAHPSIFDVVEEAAQVVEPLGVVPVDEQPVRTDALRSPREEPGRDTGARTAEESSAPPEPMLRPTAAPERPPGRPVRAAAVEEASALPTFPADPSPALDADPEPVRLTGTMRAEPVPPASPLLADAEPLELTPPTRPRMQPAPPEAADARRATAGLATGEPDAWRPAATPVLGGTQPPELAVVGPGLVPPEHARPAPGPLPPRDPEAVAVPAAPTVVIDEIRIVTPPPPAPPVDPLASLAARRVGASRHRGGARWPA